jgi:hypothetical protein
MADLSALSCLQFLKRGNKETERHSVVVNDQLDELSSRRGTAEFAIGNVYFVRGGYLKHSKTEKRCEEIKGCHYGTHLCNVALNYTAVVE